MTPPVPPAAPARRARGGSARLPAVLVTGAALNAAAIRAACTGGAMGAWRLVEDAAALAEAGEDGAVLVAAADPVRHVAAALAAGAEPLAAVTRWIALARVVLRLRRQISRPVVLLDEAAWSEPALAAAVAADLEQVLGLAAALPQAAPAAPVPAGALVAALALVAADADLSAAIADFRALTLGARGPGLDAEGVAATLATPSADPAATEALEQLTEAQSTLLAEATARLAEREAEAALLRAEAADRHVLQASTEALERRLAEARARAEARETALAHRLLRDGRALDKARESLSARDGELTRHLSEVEAAAAREAALLADLDQTRAALAQAQASLSETQADLAKLRGLAQAMQDELDRIHGSKSWRLTEPLRAGRRLLGG